MLINLHANTQKRRRGEAFGEGGTRIKSGNERCSKENEICRGIETSVKEAEKSEEKTKVNLNSFA